MSRSQSQIVCEKMINQIMIKGAQMSKDNNTIKKHCFSYANKQTFNVTNSLAYQFGAQIDIKQNKQKPQQKPKSINKDINCCLSMKMEKIANENKKTKVQRNDSIKSPRIRRRQTIQINKKIAAKTKQNNDLIDLSAFVQSPRNDGRRETQAMRNQKKYEQQLKNRYYIESERTRKLRLKQKQDQQKQQQRINSLKHKLSQHLSFKNNKISFDAEGQILFIGSDAQQNALAKKYPPSHLRYGFEQQIDPILETHHKNHHKQKVAQGKAFASAVLKTMNMSKFSLNLTSKTCNIDQFAFMKRNDLFNNNHGRQVTTIPFLQVSEGTHYTETNTNLSVNKRKTERTTHSQNKSKFKTHSLAGFSGENNRINLKSQQIQQEQNNEAQVPKKRSQTCRPSARNKFNVPSTAKTFEVVTPVNKKLMFELIE